MLRRLNFTINKDATSEYIYTHCTHQQPPQRGGAVPDPVWVGSKRLLAFQRNPVTPGTPSNIFLPFCPLNDCRRASHSFSKIRRLSSPFSCLFYVRLRLLILLLLLMSSNADPNSGPIYPCSICAGNVTWRGKSVQCCTWSKWVHLSCSLLPSPNSGLLVTLISGAAPCCFPVCKTVTFSTVTPTDTPYCSTAFLHRGVHPFLSMLSL